ncbi:MAG: TadE family protein [Pirellula sp.]|jgi:hypothetical protein
MVRVVPGRRLGSNSTLSIVFAIKNNCKKSRRGAALVELAVSLPVLFLITMATIETCRVIYLRQSVKIAAFESARLSNLPGATFEIIKMQTDCVLLGRNIRHYEVTCTPNPPSAAAEGDLITIRVTAPISENSVLTSWIYRDRVIDESVRIMKD